MANKPVINSFSQIAPIIIQQYERYLPTAFDDTMTMLEKVNSIINYLNTVTDTVNDVVTQWNTVMEWVMNDGLTQDVSDKLDAMATDGTLKDLINIDILGQLTDLQTTEKGSIVGAINENVSKLADLSKSVRYNGAKGDGVTDDTDKLQKFFDSDPKIVIVPDGTYLVDIGYQDAPITDGTDVSKTAISLNYPVKIVMSPGAVFKAKDGSGSATDNYIFSVNSEGVTFEYPKLDGNRYNTNSSYGIQINKSNCTIYSPSINNTDGSPILINGLTDAQADHIHISFLECDNVGNTLFAVFSSFNEIHNIKGTNCSEGIDFDKLVTDTNVSNIYFDTTRGTGADAAVELNGCKRVNISNVIAKNFLTPVLINGKIINGIDERSEDITVDGVIGEDITGYGVTVGNVFKQGDDLLRGSFSNINIKRATFDGIQLRGQDISLINAYIDSCGYGGLTAIDGCVNMRLKNITVINCDRYAADLTNVDNLDIDGFYVRDNNKQPSENGPFPALRINGGVNGRISGMRAIGEHDYGLKATGTNDLLLSDNYSSGHVHQAYSWSSTTTINLIGQNIGDVPGGLSLSGNRVFYGSGLPTSSFSSVIGDTIINTTPSLIKNIDRWECVAAGTPGTFIAYGCGRGTTSERTGLLLTTNDQQYQFFDTDLNKFFLWNGSVWLG